jgi:hypothetical protein
MGTGIMGGMLALSLIAPCTQAAGTEQGFRGELTLAALEFSPSSANKMRFGSARARMARDGAFSVSDIRGVAGRPTAIPVTLPSTRSSDYALLTIRGLPRTISLSSGFRFEDSWAVALSDVDNLAMFVPADFNGRFNLEVQLIKGQDIPPEKLIVPVEIRRRADSVEAVAGVTTRTAYRGSATRTGEQERVIGPARTHPARRKVTPKEEARMIERGNRLLQTGDITAARMVFERLGRRQSAKGAFAAGLTFDPQFFKTIKVIGLKPNVKKARNWYKRSAELGNQEAARRLSALGKLGAP